GGGRWMGWGAQPSRPEKSLYGKWEAKTAKTSDGWTAEIRIPYSLLGWKNPPAKGTTLAFNLCRQRLAGKDKELSAWNAVRGNFHEKSRFGLLVFGSLNGLLESRIAELRSRLAEITKESPQKEELKKKLAKTADLTGHSITRDEWRETRKNLILLGDDIFFLKLSGITFSVTSVDPSSADFELPMIPENIEINDNPVECAAAVNGFATRAVFITNLTNKTQDYRVLLCAEVKSGIEVFGLKTGEAGTPFPANRIQMRQGVRVKDSDAKSHRQRFDPLPLMNQAYTITVPPKDSGLVWLSFDCRGVEPGVYKGFLRVIPLDESAEIKLKSGKGWVYQGNIRDIPVALKVWPFELSKTPVIPLWLMNMAPTERFFNDMVDHGNRIFQLSPYSFKIDFNDDGSVKGLFPTGISNIVANHMKWAKKRDVRIKFLVGFSAYNIFQKHIQKNKFKYGSNEWRVAWTGWLKAIETFFKKHGIANGNYYVEIWDEPHGNMAAKVIETCGLARKACPDANFQITLGASKQSLDALMKMLPSVDVWCLWGSHYNNAALKPFLNELKRRNKKVWMYYCDTNMRASSYRYYRLHAWKGLYHGDSVLGVFKYMSGPGGYFGRGSWKISAFGSLAYNSFNAPVPSIRYECLREGFEDLKYIRKLKETLAKAEKSAVDRGICAEAEKFLKTAVFEVVVNHPHDTASAPAARERAAELIVKLQKAMAAK
ncbi:MAG: hypothetical protein KAG97_04190, partial [Victivallales bacterium]|nr:hypothetical protein [Victivallales bacterium]